MSTVSDIFNQLGLTQWWSTSLQTQLFGQNGEMGTDYGLPYGTPVGSLTSGTVVYVGDGGGYSTDTNHSSLGQVVQVLTPDGALLHYQHMGSASVVKGQSVGVGTILGTSSGCPLAGMGWAASGNNGCPNNTQDAWTTGAHLEVRYSPTYNPSGGVWSQNWINPIQSFLNLAGQTASSQIAGTSGSQSDTTASSSASGTSGTSTWQTALGTLTTKAGLFIIAFILTAFGAYVAFKPQADKLISTGVNATKKAAVIAA